MSGDMGEMGEKGVTLSGGQQQKVAVARAVYGAMDDRQGGGVILMDHPLTALDTSTGHHSEPTLRGTGLHRSPHFALLK